MFAKILHANDGSAPAFKALELALAALGHGGRLAREPSDARLVGRRRVVVLKSELDHQEEIEQAELAVNSCPMRALTLEIPGA